MGAIENGHETALELVSGANFVCALQHFSGPARFKGSRAKFGRKFAKNLKNSIFSSEMALELISGADFLCNLMCGAGPVDLRGSRVRFRPPRPQKIDDLRSVTKPCIKNPREMALELVSGADFLCNLMCGAGPVDLRGSRGRFRRPDPQKSTISGRLQNPVLKTPAKWP